VLSNFIPTFQQPPPFTQQTHVHFPEVFYSKTTFIFGFTYFRPFDQMILLLKACGRVEIKKTKYYWM
jgi:hypothetical protein